MQALLSDTQTLDAGRARLVLAGYLGLSEAADCEKSIRAILDQGCRELELDLRDLSYVSSAGAGVLIRAYQALKERAGTIRLIHVQPKIREHLQRVGLDMAAIV